MVLDNQAAQTFLAAAQMLTGVTGQELAGLQKETNELKTDSQGMTIVNSPTNVMNQSSQSMVLPTAELAPGNGGSTLER